MSKKLTAGGKFGTGWGLKQPTATVMNLALGFDGTFFTNKDGKSTIDVGDNELQVPNRIHEMAYSDKSLDPVSLTQSGTDVLPGFFGGKYAMYVGGNYVAQQITESRARRLQLGGPPAAGRLRTAPRPGRQPADHVGLGAEQAHRAGGEVHRLLHERREPGQAGRGRLADPGVGCRSRPGVEGHGRQERLGRHPEVGRRS